MVSVMADQIAGGGAYTVYATRQRAGAGSAYEYQGRATFLVTGGITSVLFSGVMAPCNASDVIKVYLTGLPADTATPDIICEFWDLGYLRATTAGRTLNVSADGAGDANLVQILATLLTETVTGYLAAAFKKLFDVAAPVLTSGSVNQTGDNYARLGAPAGVSISADIAAQPASIWNRLTSALATSGSIGKLIVDYLDMQVSLIYSRVAAANVTVTSPVVSGGNIEIVPGDDYYYADGRSLDWSSSTWPNLTGATITFSAVITPAVSVTMSAPVAGTGSQTVRLELSKTNTASLVPFTAFTVVAVLNNGHTVTLVEAVVS